MADTPRPIERIYPLPELSLQQDMELGTNIADLELDLLVAAENRREDLEYRDFKQGLVIYQRAPKEPRPYLDNDGRAAFITGATLTAASMIIAALVRKRRK